MPQLPKLGLPRLVTLAPLTKEIKERLDILMAKEGACSCGDIIHTDSPRFILMQVNSDEQPVGYESLKNTVALAAYCVNCTPYIHRAMKDMKWRKSGIFSRILGGRK